VLSVVVADEHRLEEEPRLGEVDVHLSGHPLVAAPSPQEVSHAGTQRDRRVHDRAYGAWQIHGLFVVEQPVLLVPVDVGRVERLDREQRRVPAADAAVQVQEHVTGEHVSPDLLARRHAVDARDHQATERLLSGVVLLYDLDFECVVVEQVLLSPLHLGAVHVLRPVDQVRGDVTVLDHVRVVQAEPPEPHGEDGGQDGRPDAADTDHGDDLVDPAGVEDTDLVAEVRFERHGGRLRRRSCHSFTVPFVRLDYLSDIPTSA